MAIHKILIVDDEPLIRRYIEETLNRLNYEVVSADSGQKACHILEKDQFDLIITDMKMNGMSGLDVIKRAKSLAPETLIIVMTAYASIENVVQAMQLGAYHYLTKPFEPETLESILLKASQHQQLAQENSYLRHPNLSSHAHVRTSHTVIAKSRAMQELLVQLENIAPSRANVFISGESGTGKEVIAQALHHMSPRNLSPFIRVNCAALPESLIESEFFGHERGAFTGADSKREGRFELAHMGSLLLDEITEIPIHLQAKLLRAIQEQEFERLGGKKTIKVDVRIISTSNRNLKEAIANKSLREDLYYRLNVIPIHLPPLRDRPEDILPLAEHYLKQLCLENHKPLLSLSEGAKKQLLEYMWPGNVRELINVMERSVVLNTSGNLTLESSHLWIRPQSAMTSPSSPSSESLAILEALRQLGHSKAKLAQTFGISEKTLEKRLQTLDTSPS